MSGLGAPVLEAYSAGYDPEKHRGRSYRFEREDEFDDWSDEVEEIGDDGSKE